MTIHQQSADSSSYSIERESLSRAFDREFDPAGDRELIRGAIDTALGRIDAGLEAFGDQYPEPSSVDSVYATIDNVEWTNGFWTGLLWLAYEASGEEKYRSAALKQVESFSARIFERVNVDHHDLGFLYSLSCVSAYKLTGSRLAREAALEAANLLYKRYLPNAGIIQAWGDLNDPEQAGRMIIDCNLNLPLLYWAAAETGNTDLKLAADTHIENAARYIVRADGSTHHTFHMDPVTGAPKYGSTHQGFSDESCWSRGQGWGIAGFPLVYRYYHNPRLVQLSARLANYFLNRLPADDVCCWDLVFREPSHERDTSAAAIAVCGLLELNKTLPLADPDIGNYRNAAVEITRSLIRNYACGASDAGTGLLKEGVYHMPNNVGVGESCIWGDYFYLEALVRLTQTWDPYW
ncbi:glycoside hydrolase family 88 protein [Microbulbifer rhizosphaerae]|uniref:Unsaturated chondroitin disaccharide hydrolase n=1 Tax=Microbulbifer rhizosphaerae TaxID=1562603 RepID=A0A7W4WCS3_9GAMM|nr:glycoside hydrolase family 88 protein [Microbulbifer rhizosphaerae]MBB3061191.1 unsaturated chondroitin disaccharide hydrolase [Microbulbifer rhizosphaerae]